MSLQGIVHLLRGFVRQTGPGQHHQIQSAQFRLVTTETFPRHPLDAVPVHGALHLSAGDRQTETRPGQTVGAGQDRETVITGFDRAAEDPFELGALGQPQGPGKTRRSGSGMLLQGVRRARPLARRAFSTRRPFLVAMRARKPWVRLRFRTLGWNVLFMTVSVVEPRRRPGHMKRRILLFRCQPVNMDRDVFIHWAMWITPSPRVRLRVP